jgi:uroporphyrin-3 C-methyltransferase
MEQDNNAQLTHTPPASATGSATAPAANKTATDKLPRWRVRVLILAALVLVIILQWVDSRRHISHLQQALDRRLASTDQMAKAATEAVHESQQAHQALAAKVALLDERLLAMQGQSAALQAMYQEMSSSRDLRLLAELEQMVTLAMQQLQFVGNVSAALIALENADARLAQEPQPQFMPLRRLLARDIGRLKAMPGGDVAGLLLKLESVVTAVDSLPLAFDQRPNKGQSVAAPVGLSTAKPAAAETSKSASSMLHLAYWQALVADIWHDVGQSVGQLVRIERIESQDTALLAPSQSFFLRENLKLRLLNARVALLQRDGKAFHENIAQAVVLLDRYFDARATSVVAARKSLASLSATEVGAALPSLDETLSAVRQLKPARERVPRR